jgi:hypothetical protein
MANVPPLTQEVIDWYFNLVLLLFFLATVGVHKHWWPFVIGAMQDLSSPCW